MKEMIFTYDRSDEGVTLRDLEHIINDAHNGGASPDSEIRVRTFFRANGHGAKIKKITVVSK